MGYFEELGLTKWTKKIIRKAEDFPVGRAFGCMESHRRTNEVLMELAKHDALREAAMIEGQIRYQNRRLNKHRESHTPKQ